MKPVSSKKLERLIDVVRFTHEFREVLRYAGDHLGNKSENDAEHSYQLAMVAWFIIDQEKLKLNKELCFMYALSHDLVEVYAGDTPTYHKTQVLSKQQREEEALKKIKERFSHFPNLIQMIESYDKKEDAESVFVYALDKMLPPIQIYLEQGKMWHVNNMCLNDLLENKNHKIAISPEINQYWQEFLKELVKNKESLFPATSETH